MLSLMGSTHDPDSELSEKSESEVQMAKKLFLKTAHIFENRDLDFKSAYMIRSA